MTPEQRQTLQTVTADTTAAQALTARALAAASGSGGHGCADVARRQLAAALDALRDASEMLRQEALHG